VPEDNGFGPQPCADRMNPAIPCSLVNLPAVSNTQDAHELPCFIDTVNDTVIADADTPDVFLAAQLLATLRPWVVDEGDNLLVGAGEHGLAQGIHFPLSGLLNLDGETGVQRLVPLLARLAWYSS